VPRIHSNRPNVPGRAAVLTVSLTELGLAGSRISNDPGREEEGLLREALCPKPAECIMRMARTEVQACTSLHGESIFVTIRSVDRMLKTPFSVWIWEILHRFRGPVRGSGADPHQPVRTIPRTLHCDPDPMCPLQGEGIKDEVSSRTPRR